METCHKSDTKVIIVIIFLRLNQCRFRLCTQASTEKKISSSATRKTKGSMKKINCNLRFLGYSCEWLQDRTNNLPEVNGHLRDINIVIFLILTSHYHIKMFPVWRQICLGHFPGQIYQLPIHPLFMLREHAVIK